MGHKQWVPLPVLLTVSIAMYVRTLLLPCIIIESCDWSISWVLFLLLLLYTGRTRWTSRSLAVRACCCVHDQE
jgi:hypothetical protein